MTIINPNCIYGTVTEVSLDYAMRLTEMAGDPKRMTPTDVMAWARLFRDFLSDGAAIQANAKTSVEEIGGDMTPIDRQAESLGFVATVIPGFTYEGMFDRPISEQDIERILGLDAAAASALGIVGHE